MEQFRTGNYLSIITYTKTGKEIPTPVWFVAGADKVHISTPKTTYKIRRLTNDPRVQIAPCTRNGKVLGTYVTGRARLLPPEEHPAITTQFRNKYGFLFKIWGSDIKNLFRTRARRERKLAFVEITLQQ